MIHEDESKKMKEISETLRMLNDLMDAIIRAMENPDPNSDDVASLDTIANDESDDEWVDESWDETMALLPVSTLYIRKPGDPWVK